MGSRSILIGAAVLTLAALAPFTVSAQGVTPQTHDFQISAKLGAQRMFFQHDRGANTYTSSSFVQVTGMGGIVIPDGEIGILVATFTAESLCTGGSWCSVRIVCNGNELLPAVGTDFAFNSPGTSYKSLSVTRRSQKLTGGTHQCDVQTAQVGGSSHRVDDWTFEVVYWRKQ